MYTYKLRLFAAICVLYQVNSYPNFRDHIPNGYLVTDPCTFDAWPGVGHENIQGHGHVNPFGRDFKGQGHSWTETLCRKDSDGDGRTNGEELGDPRCVWILLAIPQRRFNITHPGICDPFTSELCKSKNYFLEPCLDDD